MIYNRAPKSLNHRGFTHFSRRPSMFNRVTLFAVLSMLILCLAGCGASEEPKQAAQPAAAPPPKPVEEKVPVYELTKDDITTHEGWTSRNISVLGVKLGD